MNGINYATTHTAHLQIIKGANATSENAEQAEVEIEAFMAELLREYKHDDVSIDDGFCCNALTEVGLIGNDLAKVKEVAEKIITFVHGSEFLAVYV